ncbi:FAD/FMN-containing dehydrogenase with methyltransferase domain [Fadolivirus algeromassiliense]|jgi:ubiquinone/menaquinone biosynthesis C-methylase UbiE|uniref:FAD/FMN-containing dehydrogenase with methyltransferase domain n=1 Tax=Fadolivirus FV1/VV64 TaxID=3070911 RepID=A0A7D3QV13_9VIRU|nr:FAD/FMN-containing dehydrogenase with methyltransferase domain [Fadolivirus algeromassiliense]QKF94645.1 FAD/FMN-containing dehydrogenase with methyltransferase domain [Fadolivirus FV1/VV64]
MILLKYIIVTIFIICVILIYYFNKKEKTIVTSNLNFIKSVDDVSKMNNKVVERVFNPLSLEDIVEIINLAKINKKQIIAKGQSHSMGGQSIVENGYIIDTKFMNHVLELDQINKTVTVEPGITWYELINFLNNYGYSPEILQSYASFSIGGSVSVNIHGITSDSTLAKSIIELEIINSDGEIIACNRQHNNELFSLIIGGYGLFGIITKVKLTIVDNTALDMESKHLNIYNFINMYESILNNENIRIKIARINVTNMEDINLYLFKQIESTGTVISKLDDTPKEMSKLSQLLYKWVLPNPKIQKIRFDLEKALGKPLDINKDKNMDIITTNDFLYESATPLARLYSPLIDVNKTHILQEYFIPNIGDNFVTWMHYLRSVFIDNRNNINGIDLLNITIRYVLQDQDSYLKYANKNMYAFVFYYRIECTKQADNKLKYIHNLLVNKALELSGTFYLPYRHHYSYQQLELTYPNIKQFILLKKKYDSDEMFSNLWYQNYKNILNESSNIPINVPIIDKQITFIIKKTDNQIINNNAYRLLLSTKIGKQKLKKFLVNVFNLTNPYELYNFINSLYKTNKNITDKEMFLKIRDHINNMYSSFGKLYDSYTLLNKQTEIITNQIKELLLKVGINYPLNNYVNIGDSGRYINALKNDLNINGKIYSINNLYDYMENINSSFKSKFIKYDFNQMDPFPLKDNSVELVTCLIGIHHFREDKLKQFIDNIYRILKPNGIFILRDHNATSESIPLIHCAHNVFNAVVGEKLETELNEFRNFKPFNYWRDIIESSGFNDMRIYTMQQNDSTENLFACFMKLDNMNQLMPLGLKSNAYKNLDYKRSLSQTYLTTPEWYSVDLIKEYGNYLEHTPWYDYPYFKNIIKYWEIFMKSSITSINKTSFNQTLSSWSYIFMNFVIGVIVTIMFVQLGLLSIIPSFFYHLPGNDETSNIRMIVYSKNDISNLDNRIKIIESEKDYHIVEIPRYKQFSELLIRMINSHTIPMEIAGQTQIQMRVSLDSIDKNQIDKIEILYDYDLNENSKQKQYIVNVLIGDLWEIVNNNKVKIHHIYDY